MTINISDQKALHILKEIEQDGFVHNKNTHSDKKKKLGQFLQITV